MIEVVTPQSPYAGWQFDAVTKWHVDDDGHLHLQYPDKAGNAATFAKGEWLAVYDATTDPTANALTVAEMRLEGTNVAIQRLNDRLQEIQASINTQSRRSDRGR